MTGWPPEIVVKYQHGKRKEKYWIIEKDIIVNLSNGDFIQIKKGFQTDLSSVPKILWGLFPPFGDFILASIVHDWLYFNKYKAKECGTKRARKFADNEMLYFSNILNNRNFLDYIGNNLRYYAVRLFGKKVYVKVKQ